MVDRRTLIAIALCFLILFGWQKFYQEPRMLATQQATIANQGTQPAASSPASGTVTGSETASSNKPASSIQHTAKPLQTEKLQSGTGDAIIGNGAPFFVGWNLKGYQLGIAHEAAAVDLKSVTNEEGEVLFAFDDRAFEYINTVSGDLTRTQNGVTWKYSDANLNLTREFTSAPNQNWVDVKITAEFKTKPPSMAFILLTNKGAEKDPDAQDRNLVYWTNGSFESQHVKEKIDSFQVATPVKWIGATNRYFLFSAINQSPVEPKGLIQQGTAPYGAQISMAYPITGNSISIPFRAYFGPKKLDVLRTVEPTLDHTVDFGWFTAIAYPILRFMQWLYSFVRNYGIAIILLTVTLKIVTFPLTYKSMKSMKQMAKVQPQLAKLKEKYKDDKESLNREMLTLMRTQGYNPAAGCVPILIQMPVFFALYRVLYSSIELYHAPFGLWIHDLSAHDPYFVTPVLLSLTMFIQQKLTPSTAADPMQAKMMQLMPLIFGAFMLFLPSGLTLYMLVNALASIVQQIYLNKKLDAPAPAR